MWHSIFIIWMKFVVSRPKLVSGSAEGYSGHVDGHPREARMNHPKGFTLDARGNVYIADTMNMAIRKISDTGISTNSLEIPFTGTRNLISNSIFVAGSFPCYILLKIQHVYVS